MYQILNLAGFNPTRCRFGASSMTLLSGYVHGPTIVASRSNEVTISKGVF